MAYAYLCVERQRSASLAIRYPSVEQAEVAETESLFIDGLAEEDCLDMWVDDEVPPGFELLQLAHRPAYVATYRAPAAQWEAAAIPPERVARLPFEDAVVALMTPRAPGP